MGQRRVKYVINNNCMSGLILACLKVKRIVKLISLITAQFDKIIIVLSGSVLVLMLMLILVIWGRAGIRRHLLLIVVISIFWTSILAIVGSKIMIRRKFRLLSKYKRFLGDTSLGKCYKYISWKRKKNCISFQKRQKIHQVDNL